MLIATAGASALIVMSRSQKGDGAREPTLMSETDLYVKAQLDFTKGDCAGVGPILKELLDRSPRHGPALEMMTECLVRAHQHREALPYAERMYKGAPSKENQIQLLKIYRQLGLNQMAEELRSGRREELENSGTAGAPPRPKVTKRGPRKNR